ncbi:MAG TPA: GNAT family N-acetyltransferase [Rhizomicrobium sp.]|nr:GNAT family N-acetyltransferase [Rhizomicrobium sp.]
MTENPRRYDLKDATLTLRRERADDAAFLFALFVSHASRPFKLGGIPQAIIDQQMAIQYRSQTGTHRTLFPDAAYSIIENDGEPIGRLIEHDEGETVYFVDFAFLPERQAKGLGTALIEKIADEWGLKGRAARVEVLFTNAPSLKLCANLGFVRTGEKAGYIELRRAPRTFET